MSFSIENTHLTEPGLELQDHFPIKTELIDLTKIVFRRASGDKSHRIVEDVDPAR